jgi:hypothetical protein
MMGSERGFTFLLSILCYAELSELFKMYAKTAKIPVQVSIKYLCFKFML